MFQNLLQCIDQHNFVEGLDDEIPWKFDSSGNFSIKSFSLQVFRSTTAMIPIFNHAKIVWKGLAPPRVELLVCFIRLGRLSIKDRLCRFSYIVVEDSLYVFCSSDQESISYLFFACPIVWRFWHNCMNWWGIQFCYSNSPLQFFEAWIGAIPRI